MLERGFVEVLLLHGGHHVSGQCELVDLEVERRPLGQPGHFERQLVGRSVEDAHVRHMKHARQTHKVLDFVVAPLLQRGRRVRLHNAAKVFRQICDVGEWQTAVNNKRMRRIQFLRRFGVVEGIVPFCCLALLFAHFCRLDLNVFALNANYVLRARMVRFVLKRCWVYAEHVVE